MPNPGNESVQSRPKRRARILLAGVGTAAAVTIFGVAGAQALTAAQVQHFVECFGWMITDPDKHADNCLPGHVPAQGTLSEKVPPAPEPELDSDEEYDISPDT